MRLEADYPPAKYPKYISDSPDAAVEELIGREEELKELYCELPLICTTKCINIP